MRNQRLDILRGIAVLVVLVHHVPVTLVACLGFAGDLFARRGWVAMDLFFVLSGFLIGGLLFREYRETGGIRPGRFLVRRALKIYPGYYLCLAAATAIAGLGHGVAPGAVVKEALFVQNYAGGFLGHTWTLAIEEHFYLLLAGYATWRASRGGRAPFGGLPSGFALLAVAVLALRILTAWGRDGYDYSLQFHPTHLRIDSLAFGVLLAYFAVLEPGALERRLPRHPLALGLASAALLLPALLVDLDQSIFLPTGGHTLLYLGFGGLTWLAARSTSPTGTVGGTVAFVGRHSYAIYLWHVPLRWLLPALARMTGATDGALVAAYLAGSLAVGTLLSILVEAPILAWRDRRFPRPAAAVSEPAPERLAA